MGGPFNSTGLNANWTLTDGNRTWIKCDFPVAKVAGANQVRHRLRGGARTREEARVLESRTRVSGRSVSAGACHPHAP